MDGPPGPDQATVEAVAPCKRQSNVLEQQIYNNVSQSSPQNHNTSLQMKLRP